jgi:hypothetical protein
MKNSLPVGAEELYALASAAQSQFWQYVGQLESLLKVDIDSTRDFENYTVDTIADSDEDED